MSKSAFYMNSPCEIIREISDEFSEVKVYPKFADSIEGSQWCTACMVGPGYVSHTCETYQDVIDAINDTQASMIVVVENRLLHDKPIEFAKWEQVSNEVVNHQEILKKIKEEENIARQELARISDYMISVHESIDDAKSRLSKLRDDHFKAEQELRQVRGKTSSLRDKVNIGGVTLSLTSGELRSLIKNNIILEKLEAGGVDNWQWYGESMDGVDIDSEVDDYISNIRVNGLGDL